MIRTLAMVAAVASVILGVDGKVLLANPDAPISAMKGGKMATGQKLDSNFWGQSGGETYGHHEGRFYKPQVSSTFSLIKLNNVNVTFLDNTNLRGYDGADVATLGKYKVETRMGMIEHCNSRNFDDVDGILGFGWADQKRSAALLKTLTQPDRPGWNIEGQPFAGDGKPMPRKFAFTANNDLGELHLGGYDPAVVDGDFVMMPMSGVNVYGIDIHSITYGGVELLNFDSGKDSFVGEFDSGTTCLLLPNTDVKGNFSTSPFGVLAREQAGGKRFPLVYHTRDVNGQTHTYEMAFTECVEPTDETMILGDPWFRKFVVMHDLENLNNRQMGLAKRATSYKLGATTDRSILTPGHEPIGQLAEVSKVHARRKVRGGAFTQALHETKLSLAQTSELQTSTLVDKVAVRSQSMVTYNIQLAIGTPPQPLEVIFDTGSFMLAVFAEAPPKGMKPLLKGTPKKAKPSVAAKVVSKVRSLVSRADVRETEELAGVEQVALLQRATGVAALGGWGYEAFSGALFAASAMALVGVAAAVRRRRTHRGGAAGDAGLYGAC